MRYPAIIALILLLLASPARATMAYASNEKDNTISVIDLDKQQVVKTVPTGQRPRGMALTSDGKRLLVCLGDSNRIDILDTTTWQVAGSINTPDPEYAALRTPENNPLYVSNENNALITVWNIDTQKPLVQMPTGVEPEGMAVSPNGELIVNTTETTNMAQFFSFATGKNLANVLVPPRPRWAAFTPDGSQVWVSSELGGAVTVIDATTFKILDTIHFEVEGLRSTFIQPVGISITSDGKLAFVALGPANRVAVVSVPEHKVLSYVATGSSVYNPTVKKYLLVGQRPWHLAFTPDGKYLLTANGLSNDVSVIRVADLRVINTIPVGQQPWMILVSPH
ncbi:MAG TPA: PQQ-dependent catabolism-associated beta-propeller protein [Acetobacteraceae bacterium]|jgi:PQQ-dependent catabolism-associated beta-propeller protein|nr:PQQ-dependent catabolism-associated beta-propeller protein [Acetobacteraceae bacterium]HTB42523.1 PQQ-dependent catabolism-associated beta-propeller protein [Acetobacteraceae bacterium]